MFQTLNSGSSLGTHRFKSHTFTPTGTIVYIVKHEFFTIVHIHWLKQIKGEKCSCWLFQVLHLLKC
jgi:hypothetical protein